MGNEQTTINLPQELVKPIIEAKINEAILEGMKGSEHLINQAVVAILNQKVDSDGKMSRYSSENNVTLLRHLVTKAIRDAATEAVKSYVAEKQPEIRKAITAQLETKSMRDKFAKALIEGTVDMFASSYRMNVNIDIKENR